jgi:hypothetical protein
MGDEAGSEGEGLVAANGGRWREELGDGDI